MNKKITYKGVAIYNMNNIVIDKVDMDVRTRTNNRPVQTYHGSVASPTLGTFRLITVSGRIFSDKKTDCENAKKELDKIINLEGLPFTYKGYYDLERIDESGEVYTTRAKVEKIPSYERDANGFTVRTFVFELLAEDIRYYKKTININNYTDAFGSIGGFDVPFDMPFDMDTISGAISITNNGNFQAPVKIQIDGNVINPKIVNLDNNRFYGIESVTNNLIIDNTTGSLLVTDNGNDVSLQRIPGSSEIFLDLGVNNFVLLGTGSSGGSVDMTISFRDTFTSN